MAARLLGSSASCIAGVGGANRGRDVRQGCSRVVVNMLYATWTFAESALNGLVNLNGLVVVD